MTSHHLSWKASAITLLILSQQPLAHAFTFAHEAGTVVGVYPISGQYAILSRFLYYALWILAVACTFAKWTWPAVGALAYIMAYSATAAVHALLLAIISRDSAYDLDVPGAWAILSVAVLVAPTISWHSNQLRESVYRPIFAFWTTFVSIGSICCIVALFRDYPTEPACWSVASLGDVVLLTRPTQLLNPDMFSCTYSCFQKSQLLRDLKDVTIVTSQRISGLLQGFLSVSVAVTGTLGLYWGVIGFCFAGDRRRTRAELQASLSTITPAHSTARMRMQARRSRQRAAAELRTGRYQQVSNRFLYVNPVALPLVIVFNEMYLLAKTPLPSNEAPYMIGQWGQWVTVFLSLIAAAINTYYEPRWQELEETMKRERQEYLIAEKEKSIPRIQLDLENSCGPSSPEWEQSVMEATAETLSQFEPELPKPPQAATIYATMRRALTTNALATNQSSSQETGALLLRQRHPISYGPPFRVSDLSSMTLIQYDQPCHAYDEWSKDDDGKIVRDSHGIDWLVQRGILWHRELWEEEEEEEEEEKKEQREQKVEGMEQKIEEEEETRQ